MPSQTIEQEAAEWEKDAQKIADEWREKLSHPATKALLKEGKIHVSPLITKLLSAYPPKSGG